MIRVIARATCVDIFFDARLSDTLIASRDWCCIENCVFDYDDGSDELQFCLT